MVDMLAVKSDDIDRLWLERIIYGAHVYPAFLSCYYTASSFDLHNRIIKEIKDI